MSYSRDFETVVGVGVMILSIFLAVIVYNKGFLSDSNGDVYILNASFERIDGLNIGAEVTVSGVKIGEVKNKTLDPNNYNALLHLSINGNLKLPIDTSAEIISSSLIGDKYISLVPGAETEFLKDGDTIEFTQSSISIEGLITKFVFGMDSPKESSDTNH